MRWTFHKKSPDIGPIRHRESEHPLPWRNRPSDGLNHVTDADGRAVYDGSDAAEMFRRYDNEVQAERARRPAERRSKAVGRR
jgi:hypothetical protein